MKKNPIVWMVVGAVVVGAFAYWLQKPKKQRIEWYSQKVGTYLVDREIQCRNGKVLGRLQIDYNTRTHELDTVQDVDADNPDCTLPPEPQGKP